jgi:immunity protein, SdpI family
MRPRTLLAITLLGFVVAAAVSLWAWGQIPDSAQVPIHWGMNGQPNGWAPKWVALAIMPLTILAIGGIFAGIPYVDPRRPNLVRSSTAYLWIAGAAIALITVAHIVSVAVVLGAKLDIGRIVSFIVGAMFAVIGNFLGKTRSNWFLGIRTPWTLSSERSWTRTHRLAGYLFVAAGLLTVLLAVLAPAWVLMWGLLGSVGLAALIPVIYSYFAWREDPDRRQFGG